MDIEPTNSNIVLEATLGAIFHLYDISPRERELMRVIAGGLFASKEISSALGVSTSTVEKHIENISRKCNLFGRGSVISLFMTLQSYIIRQLELLILHRTMRPRLMVIDDEPVISEAISSVFVGAGFDATPYEGQPRELRAAVANFGPTVVVFDYFYPEPDIRHAIMHGSVRSRNAVAPVRVLITGFPENLVAARFKSEIPILYKPIDLQDLVSIAVQSYLEYQGRLYLEKGSASA